jgi:hypothetical protein
MSVVGGLFTDELSLEAAALRSGNALLVPGTLAGLLGRTRHRPGTTSAVPSVPGAEVAVVAGLFGRVVWVAVLAQQHLSFGVGGANTARIAAGMLAGQGSICECPACEAVIDRSRRIGAAPA